MSFIMALDQGTASVLLIFKYTTQGEYLPKHGQQSSLDVDYDVALLK